MTNVHVRDQDHNQPRPPIDYNSWLLDRPLRDAVMREGTPEPGSELEAIGAWCGSAEAIDDARLANIHPPILRALDAGGRRLDRVEFHPAWHNLMTAGVAHGLHGRLWEHLGVNATRAPAAAVTRAAAFYMTAGLECGHLCPLTMTSASVPVLKHAPHLLSAWLPRITTRSYDPRHRPSTGKSGVTIGMAMTERQGGSDLSGIETTAERADGDAYVLKGHKWFLSAPMSDAFIVLARTSSGLSAFLVPRLLPDGTTNGLRFIRLKDKLGNRSNASAETELDGAVGWLIGEDGRGLAVMLEMVTETRLDCALASVGLMRAALFEALHHARRRVVQGAPLAAHPVMASVLADLALDVEAALALVFRLARAFDRGQEERGSAWRRVMTPVVKYWTTKMAPAFIAEAMECLGGNGYVEESRLPRFFREAPVNAIWEGSGTVMALDLVRALKKLPDAAGLVLEDLRTAAGAHPVLVTGLDSVEWILHEPMLIDARARTLAEKLALVAAGITLRGAVPDQVSDAWIETRLGGGFRQTYGQGLERADTRSILERACPS